MFHIAICDDEKVLCTQLEDFLEYYRKQGILQISIFYSAEALYRAMKSGNHYDLIFLDIEFISMNGIEVGKKIRNELKNEKIQIIYISGKQEYAMDLFAIRPMNFLVKPITAKEVVTNVEKAMKLTEIYDTYFECKIRLENYRIPYGNIVYFESNNRKIKIHTKYETKEIYGKLKEIEKNVPSNFIRIHQSFLVNRYYITYWKSMEIVLNNTIVIPISQSYRKRVNQCLLQIEGAEIK